MKNENITKKLTNMLCTDESHKYYKSLSQIHTNSTIQLASDGYRATMYFNNSKARDYQYQELQLTDPLANSISISVIKNFVYSSFVYLNRKLIKEILSSQLDYVKSQYKPLYKRSKDNLLTTTKLSLDVSTKQITLNTRCVLSKFTHHDNNIPAYKKYSYLSDNQQLPVKIETPHQLNHNLEIVFTTQYLLDLINWHTEDQLDIMIYDSNVLPIMSIQDDRLMLLLPTKPDCFGMEES